MKEPLDAHAERFDRKAAEYDDDKGEEYGRAVSLVVEHARPGEDDVVLDLGTGTGAIALELAEAAQAVAGRDISEEMLAQARGKARERDVENVTFETGRFRDPDAPDGVDIVTSNFAMHHLDDAGKREALREIASLGARRVVLGDVMLFGEPDPEEPFYDPEVDDPATVGVLADAFTDAGFALTAVERIHDQVGVLVGERLADDARA
jgi:SAM-dependent methyltransferase